jgi:hypothetical protein
MGSFMSYHLHWKLKYRKLMIGTYNVTYITLYELLFLLEIKI